MCMCLILHSAWQFDLIFYSPVTTSKQRFLCGSVLALLSRPTKQAMFIERQNNRNIASNQSTTFVVLVLILAVYQS